MASSQSLDHHKDAHSKGPLTEETKWSQVPHQET